MQAEQKGLGWRFVIWWGLASAAGWGLLPFIVGYVFLPLIPVLFAALFNGQINAQSSEFSYILQAVMVGIVLGILLGTTFGALQWLNLRRHIPKAYWWIPATIAGLSLGIPLGFIALRPMYAGPTAIGGPSYFVFIAAIVPGIMVGLVQELVLRRHFERTWWWLLTSALSWPVSLIYMFEGFGEAPISVSGYLAGFGLVVGIISSTALLIVSRKRRVPVAGPIKASLPRRLPTRIVTATLLGVVVLAVILFVAYTLSARNPQQAIKIAGVTHMAFSPDGTLLATASQGDGTTRIWRVDDSRLLHILDRGAGGQVSLSVSFSPDGQTLASASGDNTVKLWRVRDGALLRTLGNAGHMVAFSPDGATLASVGYRTMVLWQVTDGKLIRTLEASSVTDFCSSLAFSPDGVVLAGGFNDGSVRVWRVSNGVLLYNLKAHMPTDVYIVFSPDGKTLASASNDARIRFWRVDDGDFLYDSSGDLSSVRGIAFSADGSTLVSVSYDYTVRFWRAADGKPIGVIAREQHNNLQSVVFTRDLKKMATADYSEGVVRIYGIEPGSISQGQEASPPTGQSLERAVSLMFPEFRIFLEDSLEVKIQAGGYGVGKDGLSLNYHLFSAPPLVSEAATRLEQKLESSGAKGVEARVIGGIVIVEFEQFPFKGYIWQGFIQVSDQRLTGILKLVP